MKAKLNLLLGFLILAQFLIAQTFTEVSPAPDFDGVRDGAIAFSDVDGDGDEDVLITGQNGSGGGERIAKLYTNDGTGNFTEVMDTPFVSVRKGAIAFSDVDDDGDEDVLITGDNANSGMTAKLYTNDGMGNFTEMIDTPFDGVRDGSIAFSDVDGDGDEDLLITGWNGVTRIAKLYTNDGMGNFTEVMDTAFETVLYSSIAFSDVDGDGDMDVLITGQSLTATLLIAKLYTNNGMGNFIEQTDTAFEGVSNSSIAFSDVDGDDDKDLLITGWTSSFERIAKLYTNDGMGSFAELTDTAFEGVSKSSIAFSDVDADGDNDVLIAGWDDALEGTAKLYTNDGMGNFTQVSDTLFDGVSSGSIAFSDVDGDGDEDVLISGSNNLGARIAKLYTNDRIISSMNDITIANRLDFSLFPNPTVPATLYLNYTAAVAGEVIVNMYDIKGTLLSRHRELSIIGQHTFSIDITLLTKGNYFIELDNGESRSSLKFIVQ